MDTTESRDLLAIACCWMSQSGFVQWSAVLLSFADGLPIDASCRSAGEPAKRWHMTLLRQRRTDCRWQPCCPLWNAFAPAPLGLAALPASARRGQAREALFNSQVIPSGGSRVIAALISLCHGLATPVRMYARGVLAELSGSYGNLLRKRGGRRCNAEQAAPGSAGKKAAPFLSEMLASGRFRLCGAAICFFGLILQSGF